MGMIWTHDYRLTQRISQEPHLREGRQRKSRGLTEEDHPLRRGLGEVSRNLPGRWDGVSSALFVGQFLAYDRIHIDYIYVLFCHFDGIWHLIMYTQLFFASEDRKVLSRVWRADMLLRGSPSTKF